MNTNQNEQSPLKMEAYRNPVLSTILEQIRPKDFIERIPLERSESKKLSDKELIVYAIEAVIHISNKFNFNLGKSNGYIYVYNSSFWNVLTTEEVRSFLGEAACRMGINQSDAKYFAFQENLFKQLLASSCLNIEQEPIGQRTLINLKNGTFEITDKSRSLRNFLSSDGLTYKLDFVYNPEALAPQFKKYLDRVLPDGCLQNVLAEFMGYIFAKNLKLEKCLLLYGSGANGKSVYFEIINALLGKHNVSNFSLGNLNEENNRAYIADKLLNYGSELKGTLESDIFKQLVSGEPIQARKKYQNSVIIKNYARLCFNCNDLPKDVEHTEAFFRRFLVVPFIVTIPEAERDVDLSRKIIASELPGVFNWILQGLERVLAQKGFSENKIMADIITSYKQESDNVYQFIQEHNYEKSVSGCMLIKLLYPDYRQFCQNDGYRPLSKINFSKRLKDLGYEIQRKNVGMVVSIQMTK